MSINHLIQYIIIAVIAIVAIVYVVRHIAKMHNCTTTDNDACQYCSSKSLCNKKKNGKGIANSKK